ncbi:cell envelope integrity TolA C-terminal domain-containing protein [Psychrobacter aestuarii]|uniref:TonB C-terminal domain-containing protein n=1 Tax=Psychrobacter aestuarii TaxID=556327 RepID=A0ABP3FN86_9GAMM|nr:cell envelope integrity TolA C-terminal domain-containing protein [Psychrobacter aestuarii]
MPMDIPVRTDSDAQANNNAQILQLIRSKFVAPTCSCSKTVVTALTITVNSQGYVTAVHASSNDAHAQAAIAAIRAVGRFPIDSSDPKYPTFKILFRGQN